MRIGLLSDVHGNLAGLRAVAAALAREEERDGPLERVVVAGDHLWGGARPRETWELLVTSGWTLVRGNEDERLVARYPEDVPNQAGSAYRRALAVCHAWTRAALDEQILGALAVLPLQCRIPTLAGELLVVHATPRSPHEHVGAATTPLAELEQKYAGTGATAIAFGHLHRSMVRATPFGLLVNVASVGLPADKEPLAAYTILTATPEGWAVEQRRVPYDAAEERAASVAARLPAWVPDHAIDASGCSGHEARGGRPVRRGSAGDTGDAGDRCNGLGTNDR
jgi:predicted phosphodiesterase